MLADRERQNETRRRDDERTAQERRAANDRQIELDRKEVNRWRLAMNNDYCCRSWLD